MVFVFAPAIVVASVLMSFTVIPFAPNIMVADLNIGLLFFLAMSSLGVYSIVLGGWASNNKYALLGAKVDEERSYTVPSGKTVKVTLVSAEPYHS